LKFKLDEKELAGSPILICDFNRDATKLYPRKAKATLRPKFTQRHTATSKWRWHSRGSCGWIEGLSRISISTCKQKRESAAPAGDLYVSPLFRGLPRYAETHADRWYILSAEHGVLDPGKVVHPYERTLNSMPKGERIEWAARVKGQLIGLLPTGAKVIFLG